MQYITQIIIAIAVMVMALCIPLIIGISLNYTKKINSGLLQYYCYALLAGNGIAVLLSNRNFSKIIDDYSSHALANPIAAISIKITSIFAMLAAVDQIARFFKFNRIFGLGRVLLFITFIFFWCANVLISSLFSANRVSIEISWFYSLALGLGLISLSNYRAQDFLIHFRNASLFFCAASLVLIPIMPNLVLQTDYTQGYIGLPRFAGLAPHATLMGMVATLALWCLAATPFSKYKLNVLFFTIGFLALFLSQAKNIWISFLITFPILMWARKERSIWQALTLSVNRGIYIATGGVIMFASVAMMAALLFGNFDNVVDKIFDPSQRDQLVTFTGRDQIWTAAMLEWERSPIFGYGLPLFGEEHRRSIGMYFATSGHNQIYDTLGRTGLVGAMALIIHLVILSALSYIYRRETRGLSLVLLISLVVRMATEVPITLLSISIDTLPYYLLLALLAMNMRFNTSKLQY